MGLAGTMTLMDSFKSVVVNSMTVKRMQHRIEQLLSWLQQADIKAMLRQAFLSIVPASIYGTKAVRNQCEKHNGAKSEAIIHRPQQQRQQRLEISAFQKEAL